MAHLISCQNISKTFGPKPLFSEISFGIDADDRLGIIGPNGSGKSTILKILAGDVQPDDGLVTLKKGTRLAYVPQQAAFPGMRTVRDALELSLKALNRNAEEHRAIINQVLGKVGFLDDAIAVASLSGGWKKRLSIACALVQEPEILLLDEPTNHLDLEGILWLERLLKSSSFACGVISHDRYFLENVTTRTIEFNRVYPGGMFSGTGAYSEFLTLKADFISGQLQQQASLANKVRREVEWLSRGPKARTTKQQARIQSAEKLQSELSEVSARNRQATVDIDFNASQRKTKKLVSIKDVSKKLGDRQIFSGLSMILSPGLRLGLLGLNASGKTTLLKIISKKLPVDTGDVDHAQNLRVVYFEQNRDSLDRELSLKRTLAPDSDSVVANDRSIHVVSWARKFLFRPEQMDTPVGKLSGGEQARLLIAKLMLEPADILLLDEPTNDLDIPTLEVLEESLTEFPGAVVLVTHDRYMLDRVSNVLLALDGKGGTQTFADYAQWQDAQKDLAKRLRSGGGNVDTYDAPQSESTASAAAKKKLSYMEQREYDQMESKIAAAEAKLQECQASAEDPAIAANSMRLQEAYAALKTAQDEIEHLYTRWAALEEKLK